MDWFRFYTETIHDRKIRRLPPAQRWLWVTVLAMARSSPEPGRLLLSEGIPVTVDDLVDAAAVSRKDVIAGLEAFIAQKMVHVEGDVYVVSHWNERQFVSDDSTERVRRYRQRKRNVAETLHVTGKETLHETATNVTETPPDTEADTDTEKDADAAEDIGAHARVNPQDMSIKEFEDEVEARMRQRMLKPTYQLVREDYNMLHKLLEAGVDRQFILDGIDEAFESFRPKHALDKIHSFSYCAYRIYDRWQAQQSKQQAEKTRGPTTVWEARITAKGGAKRGTHRTSPGASTEDDAYWDELERRYFGG